MILSTLALALAASLAPLAVGDAVPAGKAHVRVIHGVYDLAVDVLVDDSVLLSNFVFGDITDYVEVASGAHTLDVRAAGTTDDPLITLDVNLTERHRYSVAAVVDSEAMLLAADEGAYQPHNGSPLFVWYVPLAGAH
jgi:hypothetical protein